MVNETNTALRDMTVGDANELFKKHYRKISGVDVLNVDDFKDALGDLLDVESERDNLKQEVERLREALVCAEGKLCRYMVTHGPNAPSGLQGTYSGGLSAEYEACLKIIRAALRTGG